MNVCGERKQRNVCCDIVLGRSWFWRNARLVTNKANSLEKHEFVEDMNMELKPSTKSCFFAFLNLLNAIGYVYCSIYLLHLPEYVLL